MAFRIEYSPDAENHLKALTAAQRSLVLAAVEKQLARQPGVETRNRKPMRPNPLAAWELRVRNLRVYYSIEDEPEQFVLVMAVGVKVGNRILIGGKTRNL